MLHAFATCAKDTHRTLAYPSCIHQIICVLHSCALLLFYSLSCIHSFQSLPYNIIHFNRRVLSEVACKREHEHIKANSKSKWNVYWCFAVLCFELDIKRNVVGLLYCLLNFRCLHTENVTFLFFMPSNLVDWIEKKRERERVCRRIRNKYMYVTQ